YTMTSCALPRYCDRSCACVRKDPVRVWAFSGSDMRGEKRGFSPLGASPGPGKALSTQRRGERRFSNLFRRRDAENGESRRGRRGEQCLLGKAKATASPWLLSAALRSLW